MQAMRGKIIRTALCHVVYKMIHTYVSSSEICVYVMGLLQLRDERDSSTIRARFGYNTLQHATRFFVRSHTRSIRALHENQW